MTRRLKGCVEMWPEAQTGQYNPACCRFPKSCSADVYDDDIDEDFLEDVEEEKEVPAVSAEYDLDKPIIAMRAVEQYILKVMAPRDPNYKLMLVWWTKTLENWKAVIVSDMVDNDLYEVTFNGQTNDIYVNTYKKWHAETFHFVDGPTEVPPPAEAALKVYKGIVTIKDERESCWCCLGMGDNEKGSECTACYGSGVKPDKPPCRPFCRDTARKLPQLEP